MVRVLMTVFILMVAVPAMAQQTAAPVQQTADQQTGTRARSLYDIRNLDGRHSLQVV